MTIIALLTIKYQNKLTKSWDYIPFFQGMELSIEIQ